MNLEFIHTRSNGDETSNYDVVPSEDITVKELLYYIITCKKDEWGLVSLPLDGPEQDSPYDKMGLPRLKKKCCKYSHGMITENWLTDEDMNIKVSTCWSNGGWGAMDYMVNCGWHKYKPVDMSKQLF